MIRMTKFFRPAKQTADPQLINVWLMEKLPALYAPGRRNAELHMSGTDFWVWLDASRPTSRMTERNKRHLFMVDVKTNGEQSDPDDWRTTLNRDYNLTARTHWPVERTSTGQFAKGHNQNVRIVKDPLHSDTIIQNYGSHQWGLERDTPDSSDWMTWDGKIVNLDTILGLLNFELHPDNPSAAFEAEMMHKPRLKTPSLFDPVDDRHNL